MTTENHYLPNDQRPPQTVVLVVRNPDFANEITVYDPPLNGLRTIDVDLGYLDLTDPDEFLMWAGGQEGACNDLPDDHPAAEAIWAIMQQVYEDHHTARWPSLDDALVAAGEVV